MLYKQVAELANKMDTLKLTDARGKRTRTKMAY